MFSITKKQKMKNIYDMVNISRKRSQAKDVLARLLRNRLGLVGIFIIFTLVFLVVFAGLLSKHDYAFQNIKIRLAFPSKDHIMGTDNFGRDIWARMLYGGRISLLIAMLTVLISGTTGAILGSTSGYFGGKADIAITRILDIIMAIPSLLLAIAISVAFGAGIVKTAIAISISGIPYTARMMRSTVMAIKNNDFVEAARATGSTNFRIVFVHILPNAVAPLIVNLTLMIGGTIMSISSLSFIGLGVQPPTPEWGSILASGRVYIRDFWPIIVFPSLFIMLTLFGFNLFGDALRDALDPRLKD